MISGNCNRSPQYNAMGPPGGAQRYSPQAYIQQQQQHPHLLFMAGGSVRTFPQMSRGFSMMQNRGGVGTHAPVVQCNIQHGFSNSFGYHPNPPMFHQHHHLYQQPHVIHHQQQQQQQPHHPQPQYVPQQLIAPPPAASHNEPTSGFINGIKNMVKGIINPLNCDFYSDHHKYYNPKYRNNYMFDIKADTMSYKPPHQPQPKCHVKLTMDGLEMNKPTTKIEEKKPTQSQECTKDIPEVVAIFSSEDFPELPAPRRSRSATPAKTEVTPPKPCEVVNKEKEAPTRNHPPPKGTFFEIMCTTTPCGKRPTFGGRLKVVPPPFSLNQSLRSCRSRQDSTTSTSTNNNDCDIEEDSFVIFSNNDKPAECVFTSLCRPPRQRQLSECSDDSFVVFFTEDAELQVVNDDDDDDDDDDDEEDDNSIDSDDETCSEEEFSSDDEDQENDGIDVVDSIFLGKNNKTDKNNCDHETTTSLLCSQHIPYNGVVPREHKQFDSGFDEKKVTFDPHPVVHVMHAWSFAYRAARKGHWEDFARDRTRFQKRIERTSVYLNPVLTPEHREKIYRTRFCDDAATDQQQQQQHVSNPNLGIGSLHRASASRNDDSQKLPKLTKLPDCASF